MSGLLDLLDVIRMLRDACAAAGGQAAWARRHRISPGFVNDVLGGRGNPGERMLKALGLATVTKYVVKRRVNG